MATTKLVSANMGIVLIVEKDGKQEKKEFTIRIPTHIFDQPIEGIQELCEFVNEVFGTEYVCADSASVPKQIKIAKPKRIKAKRPISHDEFNQKIKALVP